MSSQAQSAPNPQANANQTPKSRRKMIFWLTVAFFVICALIFFLYWLIWGQFKESTKDAYVTGNMIMMTPQIDGIVTTILVDNTQMVEAGQVAVELDPHDYEIALDKAKADLGDSLRLVTQMFLKVEELEAKKEVINASLIKAQLDYAHREVLVSDYSVSREDFEHSETALLAAYAAVIEVEKQLLGAAAEIENTTVRTHPRVEQAKAALRRAFLFLHRCKVLVPSHGLITQRKAQVGQWVKASDPLMALVPIDQIWVDANFREVDLKNLRIGQPVILVSDIYGRDVKFHGKVVGLNPGTGSVFSILPPQNATGNWIKIVQRVPVKISLDPDEIKKHPLVLGLSMTVHIDTHNRDGLRLPTLAESKPIYSSSVYDNELLGVDELIDQIIADNTWDYETIQPSK